MNSILARGLRVVLSVVIAAAFCIGVGPAKAQGPPMYDVQLIELGRGDKPAELSNRGEVVGGAFGAVEGGDGYTAFLWYDGVIVDLGANWEGRRSVAQYVTDSGVIFGTVEGYGDELDRIFEIDAAGNISYPTPFNPAIDVRGTATNNEGHIVGVYQATPDGASIPFFWDGTSTEAYDLVPAWADQVFLGGLNNQGQVVGASREGTCGNSGFLWETNFFTGFGICSDWVVTNDINDAAQIVGSKYFGGEIQKHAFLFDNGEFTDLGVLEGAESSTASSINNLGWIVGHSSSEWPPSRRAFIFIDGVMYDLNDYISDETWHLTSARKINDRGQILMIANPTTGFGGVYVLLTPAVDLLVEDLIDLVESFDLPRGIERALVVKLEHALEAIIDEDLERACNLLQAFTNQVNAQKGKKITEAQAEELLEAAAQIRSVIGCD